MIVMRQRRRPVKGSLIVEFAFTFGLLFPLFAGTFDFGYCFFVYNELQNSVRQGARYASLKTYDSATAAYTEEFGTAVRNMVVYGNPAGGPRPTVPRLSASNVALTVVFAKGIPSEVKVGLRDYRFVSVLRNFTLDKPSCSFPYAGRFAPGGM